MFICVYVYMCAKGCPLSQTLPSVQTPDQRCGDAGQLAEDLPFMPQALRSILRTSQTQHVGTRL